MDAPTGSIEEALRQAQVEIDQINSLVDLKNFPAALEQAYQLRNDLMLVTVNDLTDPAQRRHLLDERDRFTQAVSSIIQKLEAQQPAEPMMSPPMMWAGLVCAILIIVGILYVQVLAPRREAARQQAAAEASAKARQEAADRLTRRIEDAVKVAKQQGAPAVSQLLSLVLKQRVPTVRAMSHEVGIPKDSKSATVLFTAMMQPNKSTTVDSLKADANSQVLSTFTECAIPLAHAGVDQVGMQLVIYTPDAHVILLQRSTLHLPGLGLETRPVTDRLDPTEIEKSVVVDEQHWDALGNKSGSHE